MKSKLLMYGLYAIFGLSFLTLILATYRYFYGEATSGNAISEILLFAALNIGFALVLVIGIKLYLNREH